MPEGCQEFARVSLRKEMAAWGHFELEGCRGLHCPGFEMLARDALVVQSAVGANRAIERRRFVVHVIAIEGSVGPQCRQRQLNQLTMSQQCLRNAIEPR